MFIFSLTKSINYVKGSSEVELCQRAGSVLYFPRSLPEGKIKLRAIFSITKKPLLSPVAKIFLRTTKFSWKEPSWIPIFTDIIHRYTMIVPRG